MVAQLTATKAPLAPDASWKARAASSLPAPLGPVSSSESPRLGAARHGLARPAQDGADHLVREHLDRGAHEVGPHVGARRAAGSGPGGGCAAAWRRSRRRPAASRRRCRCGSPESVTRTPVALASRATRVWRREMRSSSTTTTSSAGKRPSTTGFASSRMGMHRGRPPEKITTSPGSGRSGESVMRTLSSMVVRNGLRGHDLR